MRTVTAPVAMISFRSFFGPAFAALVRACCVPAAARCYVSVEILKNQLAFKRTKSIHHQTDF